MSILRVVQDGVEFFTQTKTGACKMSEAGMARLCDITQQSMNERIRDALTGKTHYECLNGFAGRCLPQQVTLNIDGYPITVNLYDSDFCAAMVEYYAFESRHKTAAALFAYRKFAKTGIEKWIQGITGWKPSIEAADLTEELVAEFIAARLTPGGIATEVKADAVIAMLKQCKFTGAGYRLYFYLEMMHLQNQHPSMEQICEELKISRSTFKKWLPQVQTWSHCADWLQPRTRSGHEHPIQLRLHAELGGKMEAFTPIGPVDLVTSTEVIEIKRIEDWKEALGQVMAKAQCFPELSMRIHLFGESSKILKKITKHCQKLDVLVTFETVVSDRPKVIVPNAAAAA
jgi:hypothetical protein